MRDKDAVSACSLAAEAAAWAMDTMGLTLYEWLQELYVKYGFYREGLVSVVRKGKEGAELIQKMMVEFRANPPKTILGSPVVKINDFLTLETTDVKSGAMTPIVQDRSDVLRVVHQRNGPSVSVRPSRAPEPKIKFYFGVEELPWRRLPISMRCRPSSTPRSKASRETSSWSSRVPCCIRPRQFCRGFFMAISNYSQAVILPRKFVFLNF